MQKPKHHSRPSVSQDSQLSSATALGHPHSHAALTQQQESQGEEEVTSPLQLGSHAAAGAGPHAKPYALPESQPMQLDTASEHQTDMELDSPADPNASQTPIAASYNAVGSDQGYVASCGWAKGFSNVEVNRNDWAKAGSSFNNPQQHASADYVGSSNSPQERRNAGQYASVSDQSCVDELPASDATMHSGSGSSVSPEGQPGAAQGQHATAPGQHATAQRQHAAALGQHATAPGQHATALGQHGQTALWQGQLGEAGSLVAPIQSVASPAAMLSLMQQANLPQGKRKQAGKPAHIPLS